MLQKSRNWLSETIWKPKKVHSLEQLRYLHYVLTKNSTVTEANKALLVETLRSIAEILIWGDQNDSRVFDFFLEKNMLLFFLKIMTQNCGSYVTVQLLQTLNILFENIKHETSLYFLLSNNHVNSIIVHKFDFSNEEVLAYYISFLKTLSLKLNRHTINFYFNEQKNDFPLYTEAIKFFNHSEGMVRIAVRTLTLNTYQVGHERMLNFICDKTADPYFSNLVWFIGKDAIELDDCVTNESDHLQCSKLKDMVADHLDHLHYLHDILCLTIERLNLILTDHLLNRLLIPLYVYSLPKLDSREVTHKRVTISRLTALFLLCQHISIMNHGPLVSNLIDVIFHEDDVQQESESPETQNKNRTPAIGVRAFVPPSDTLESQLEACGITKDNYNLTQKLQQLSKDRNRKRASTFYVDESKISSEEFEMSSADISVASTTNSDSSLDNSATPSPLPSHKEETSGESNERPSSLNLENHKSGQQKLDTRGSKSENRRTFLWDILEAMDCTNGDGEALYAVCFFYVLLRNEGIDRCLLEEVGITTAEMDAPYNDTLMEKLIAVLECGVRDGSSLRLVTLEMAVAVIKLMALRDTCSRLKDYHLAMIENVREASTLQLRNFYKGDELFLDMFETEYHIMESKPLNASYLLMDASLLLPPTGTPLTGIDFPNRLPCGEDERIRRAIRVFLLARQLSLMLRGEAETQLPLSRVEKPVREKDVLDLNNSDLIACTVVSVSRQHLRRFLVIDASQFILVEPDTSKLGWGVVRFVALLQDVEATPDHEDSRSLHITVHKPFSSKSRLTVNPAPLLSAKFVFDDYIRCMSAKQRLQRTRGALRQRKMSIIATLLELPFMAAPPSHFYTIAPFSGTGGQNYVWSPSSRSYAAGRTSAAVDGNEDSRKTSPAKPNSPRSTLISPKHGKILEQVHSSPDQVDGLGKTSTPISAKEIEHVVHRLVLDTPPPKTTRQKPSQAETLASVLEPESNGKAVEVNSLDPIESGPSVTARTRAGSKEEAGRSQLFNVKAVLSDSYVNIDTPPRKDGQDSASSLTHSSIDLIQLEDVIDAKTTMQGSGSHGGRPSGENLSSSRETSTSPRSQRSATFDALDLEKELSTMNLSLPIHCKSLSAPTTPTGRRLLHIHETSLLREQSQIQRSESLPAIELKPVEAVRKKKRSAQGRKSNKVKKKGSGLHSKAGGKRLSSKGKGKELGRN